MKIVSQSETQIVVRDSSLWISVLCGLGFLFVLTLTTRAGNWKGMLGSGLLLVFAMAWVRRSTFTFDASAQKIRWRRLRMFRMASGELPFSAVQDIRLDESTGGGSASNVTIYRPTIVTASGDVPMADVYSSGCDHITGLRKKLLAFVRGEPVAVSGPGAVADNTDATDAAELNESIRALLQQGRKVDAILLVQRTDRLDLTEATFRVNQVDIQMKTNKS
jgi:hypothetical protein